MVLEIPVYFHAIGTLTEQDLSKPQTPSEAAELIVRFLEGRSRYPQEWNDFLECRHFDPRIEAFRKRCDKLDPLVNCPVLKTKPHWKNCGLSSISLGLSAHDRQGES